MNDKVEVLVVLNRTFSALSLCGNLLTVICFLRFKNLRKFAFKLVLFLTLSEGGWGLSNFFGHPEEGSFVCYTQAFLTSFMGCAMVLWTTVIASVLDTTLHNPQEALNLRKREKMFHVYTWGGALFLSILPMLTGSYGDAGFECWIKQHSIHEFWRFFQFYVPLWVAMCYNAKVYAKASATMRALSQNSTIVDNTGRLLLTYPVVLVVAWSAASANRVLDWAMPDYQPFWLNVLHIVFSCSQGIMHTAVYFSTSLVRDTLANWWRGGADRDDGDDDGGIMSQALTRDDGVECADEDGEGEEEEGEVAMAAPEDVTSQIRGLWVASLGMYEILGLPPNAQTFQDLEAMSSAPKVQLKASVRATYFTLFKGFVGIGVLSIPHAYLNAGYVLGSLGLLAISAISYQCIVWLLRCKEQLVAAKPEMRGKVTFGAVGEYAMGYWGRVAVEISLVITQLGVSAAYLIFIGEHFTEGIEVLSGVTIINEVFIVCAGALLLPFIWLRTLKRLATPALVADGVIVFGLLTVFCYDFSTIIEKGHSGLSGVTPARLSTFPLFFGVAVFAFEGIAIVLPVEQAMQEPEKFLPIMKHVMAAVTSLLIIFGAASYVAYGDDTDDLITLNLPPNAFTTMVTLLYCVGLFFTYPIVLFPATQILEGYSCYKNRLPLNGYPEVKMRLFRALLVALTVLVAAVAPNFGLFLNVIGSLTCTALAFVLPGYFFWRLFPDVTKLSRFASVGAIVFGLIGGFVCLVLSVLALAGLGEPVG